MRERWQRIPHSRSFGVLAWLTARSNSVQPDPTRQEQPWRGARPKKKRGYNNPAHPHAPSEIMEMGKPKARTYQYDGNGNPVYYEESKSFRSMVWDEENRLRGINDNGKLHLYTYDHTGERAVKSSGESSTVVTNGLTSAVITHMDDYTAYVNPYFVVQKGKFTKHYFERSSRIVSKLGEGTFVHKNTGIMAGGIDYIRQNAQMQEARDNYIRGLKVPPGPPTQHGIYASPEWTGQPYPSLGWQNIRQDQEPPEGWPRPPKFNEPGDVPGPPVQYGDPITPQTVKAGYGFVPNGIREKNLYYYHPDHLGSSSYITDREGRITQHTEYIAFGEVLFEEHSTSKTMPYLFNGKELDTETGLYYYGARYYDPKTSIFLNVDPLAEKTMTPYAYTNNNPINLIDPTGMKSEDWVEDKNGNIFWDSRVTNQEQAEKYWGKGVKHHAPNTYGYETDKGYVLLSSDRKWVRNGTEYTAPDRAAETVSEGCAFDGCYNYNIFDLFSYSPKKQTFYNFSGGINTPNPNDNIKLIPGDKVERSDLFEWLGAYGRSSSPRGSDGAFQFGSDLQSIVDVLGLRIVNKPDTLKFKATFVYPKQGGVFRDTMFAEPYRKGESFEQVYDRLKKKYDSVKAKSSEYLTR